MTAYDTLTTADLDAMARDDRWHGFGYIGERDRTELATDEADRLVLDAANRQGMTYDDLFEWANSKNSRWFGDCMFGGLPHHAHRYLP